MSGVADFPGRIPAPFMSVGSSSFVDLVGEVAPELLPGRRPLPPGAAGELAPHGTTIVAMRCNEGMIMAGDRRATQGNMIAMRDIQKVFSADRHSLIGMAGTAGIGVEMIRLFQAELEHFEKLEGNPLSLHGKANKLANMIRGNLGAAMQGLAVVPLFGGFDTDATTAADAGRIFSYDVVGGLYEERDYDAVGSGSIFAKSALKKRFQSDVSVAEAIRLAVEALYDAADEDSATGGPDLSRNLFPTIMTATAAGTKTVPTDEIEAVARSVVQGRLENPGG